MQHNATHYTTHNMNRIHGTEWIYPNGPDSSLSKYDTYFNQVFYFQSHLTNQFAMGWLRWVGSLKSWVSFAEYSLFYRALLQQRPIIVRSSLIVATPYRKWHHTRPFLPTFIGGTLSTDRSMSGEEILEKSASSSLCYISEIRPDFWDIRPMG